MEVENKCKEDNDINKASFDNMFNLLLKTFG